MENTADSIRDMFMDGKKKLQQYKDQFFNTFKVHLEPFMTFHGFDVVKFDEHLKTPDGTSTKDFIQKQYGDDAVQLIKDLICF